MGAVACAEVKIISSLSRTRPMLPLGALHCALGKKIGVASVILQPTKTMISLAAMSSLQGTIPYFITLTPNILNLTLTLITKLT